MWIKTLLGFICYHIVMVMPWNFNSKLFCWLLGWAGYYAWRNW